MITVEDYCSGEYSAVRDYKLQKKWQDIIEERKLPMRGQLVCSRAVLPYVPNMYGVELRLVGHHGAFGGLMQCDNMWSCPICSYNRSAEKAIFIDKCLEYYRRRGDKAGYMVTFTVPHWKNESAATVYKRLAKSLQHLTKISFWRRYLVKKFGLVGRVTSIECTYGDNGFHFHCHMMLFMNAHMEKEFLDFEDRLGEEWEKCYNKFTPEHMLAPNAYICNENSGVYISRSKTSFGEVAATSATGHYVMGMEVSGGALKTVSMKSGRTMFQMLASADEEDNNKFVEYALATRHKARITISRSLLKLPVDDIELPHKEGVEEDFSETVVVATFTYSDWYKVLACEARGIAARAMLIAAVEAEGDKYENVVMMCGFLGIPPPVRGKLDADPALIAMAG